MANRVLPLRDLTAPLEEDAPWPGTAVSGDPHTKTWHLHTIRTSQIHWAEGLGELGEIGSRMQEFLV